MTIYNSVFGLLTGLLLLAATTAGAQVANDIAKQNKLGNAVFLVVTEGGGKCCAAERYCTEGQSPLSAFGSADDG